MNVRLRDTVFVGIKPGDDTRTDEALEAAQELVDTFGAHICIAATIDRFDGLVLVFEQPNASTWPGWHFATPTCGYNGGGPTTAVEILTLFGFGERDEILARISTGGKSANYPFTK
jgi:hypothetical protein